MVFKDQLTYGLPTLIRPMYASGYLFAIRAFTSTKPIVHQAISEPYGIFGLC